MVPWKLQKQVPLYYWLRQLQTIHETVTLQIDYDKTFKQQVVEIEIARYKKQKVDIFTKMKLSLCIFFS